MANVHFEAGPGERQRYENLDISPEGIKQREAPNMADQSELKVLGAMVATLGQELYDTRMNLHETGARLNVLTKIGVSMTAENVALKTRVADLEAAAIRPRRRDRAGR